MKNSIKTLTILLVTFLFSNAAKAVIYTNTNNVWSNDNGTSVEPTTTTNSDSVIIKSGGTWTLSKPQTVKGVRLSGGTLAQATYALTGNVWVKGAYSNTISGTGAVTGAVTILSGTLTIGANKTATSSWAMTGGSLTTGANVLTGGITVSASGTITSSSNLPAVTVSGGTLSLGSSLTSVGLLTLSGSGIVDMKGFNWTLGSNDITVSASATASIVNTGSGASQIGDISFTNTTSSGCNLNIGTAANATATLAISNVELIIDDLLLYGMVNGTNNAIVSFDKSPYHIVNGYNTQNGTGTNRTSNTNHINAIIRLYTLNTNTMVSFIFPIGNGTVYAPIQLLPVTVSSATGNRYYQVQYVGAKPSNTSFNSTVLKGGVSGAEYWILSTDAAKPTATVTMFYHNVNTGKNGLTNLSSTTNITADLVVAKDSTATAWNKLTSTTGTAVSNVFPVALGNAIIPVGNFTFGSTNARTGFLTPLPVSIIDFSAKANDKSIEVKWSTASEKDNAAFVVEKSIDGQTWSSIGTVKGAKTSNVVNNYGLVDYKAVAGFQYYRLKQIDLDGTVSYSKAIAVNFSKASTLNVNLFPNPAKDVLNITTENNATGEVNIQILNSMGETVYNQVVEAGLVQTIDIAKFIPGVYYLTIIAEGESKIIRLLKN